MSSPNIIILCLFALASLQDQRSTEIKSTDRRIVKWIQWLAR